VRRMSLTLLCLLPVMAASLVNQLFIAQWPPRSDGDSDRHAPGCRWSSRHRPARPLWTGHPPRVEWAHHWHYCRRERSIFGTRQRRHVHRLRAESAIRGRHCGVPGLGTRRGDQRRHDQRRGRLPGEVERADPRVSDPKVEPVGEGDSSVTMSIRASFSARDGSLRPATKATLERRALSDVTFTIVPLAASARFSVPPGGVWAQSPPVCLSSTGGDGSIQTPSLDIVNVA
jgi:hypothetical protein